MERKYQGAGKKLTKLINRLISMARAGETGEIILSKVDFSKLVEDAPRISNL